MSAPLPESVLNRGHALRNQIAEIFIDAGHWNSAHPPEDFIDPDPDGEMVKLAATLDAMLATAPNAGRRLILPIIPVVPFPEAGVPR